MAGAADDIGIKGSPRRSACGMDLGAPLDSATVSIARIAQTGRPGRPAAGIIARRTIHATLAMLAALLLALAGASATLAHAELVASDPADGEVLDASPTTIRLAFSENLDPAKSSFRLLGPDGATIGTGDATAAKAMSLQSPPLSDGTYTIKWTSASADDGDIERGQFTFTVQLAAASLPPSEPPSASTAPSASAPASTAPSIAAPSTAPSVAPTPAPSAAPAAPASSTSDVLLPIVIGLLLVAGVGAFVLRRSRGA